MGRRGKFNGTGVFAQSRAKKICDFPPALAT
jgi:hypothetical protein